MLGRHHLAVTLASFSAVILPWLDRFPELVAVSLAGAGIGSLLPDADSADAAIFHSEMGGVEGDLGIIVNSFLAPMFPIFGYTVKYLIYTPVVKLFNLFSKEHQLEYSHRGFLHSVMGVTVTTGLLGVYISPVLIYIGFFSPLYLGTFLLSIGIAQIFHMLEDSCTKSGIAWLEPFSSTRMRGALTTSPEFIHTLPPRVLGAVLGLITAGSLYFGMMDPQPLTDLEIARRAGVLVSGTWLVFLFLVARIRLD